MLTRLDSVLGGISMNIGLLILRLGVAGFMVFFHGWGKLTSYSENMYSFPDPLGVSSPVSMALAVMAEVLCGGLVAIGAFTRLACIPLMVTMVVAVIVIHADDPWAKKEFALLYFIPFLALFFTGPGAYSIDRLMLKRR